MKGNNLFKMKSWNYNYNWASLDLFGDDRLLRDPDQVATNDELAWTTAFWYWRTRVGINEQVKQGWFGTSTRLINSIECLGNQEKAQQY